MYRRIICLHMLAAHVPDIKKTRTTNSAAGSEVGIIEQVECKSTIRSSYRLFGQHHD